MRFIYTWGFSSKVENVEIFEQTQAVLLFANMHELALFLFCFVFICKYEKDRYCAVCIRKGKMIPEAWKDSFCCRGGRHGAAERREFY